MRGSALASDEEQALLERLARGDAVAFDRLVALHQERITRLAHRLLGWREEPDDVVQEVFLTAFRKIRTFRGQSGVGTWLTAITLRTCRSWRRSWRRRLRHLLIIAQSDPGTAGRSDEPLVRDELSEQVREAVCRLAPRDREVVVLYYLEQLNVAEMTAILGVSAGAIDVRLHRARGRLREMLAGRFDKE